MADAQVMQIAENTLIDIEVPLPPGMDWLGLLIMLGWGLVALLVVGLLSALIWLLWRRAQLYGRLMLMKRQLMASEPSVMAQSRCAAQLYEALRFAQRHRLWLAETQAGDAAAVSEAPNHLKEAIDQACFGRHPVSRETLHRLIQAFQTELKAATPSFQDSLKRLVNRLRAGVLGIVSERRKASEVMGDDRL